MTYDFDRVIDRRATDSNKWRKFGPDVLPLWVADMDFPSPEPVVRALRARVEHGVYGYLYEQPEFAEVMVDRLQKRYGWRVAPEAVQVMNGVIPALNVAARALSRPGDGLVLQTPVYPPILRVAGNHGLARGEAPLARDAAGRYSADLDALERAVQPGVTKLFVLCSPHNPVGRVFTPVELSGMAEVCLRRELFIVADEIHCELLLGRQQHTPIASLDPEIAARTITLMAPSKTFNLAGLKCSVAIIPDPGLRERFSAAKADLVHGVNVLGYTAALTAYRDGQPWLDALLRYLEATRDFLTSALRKLPGVSCVPPEATYLAWLDCRGTGLADPYTFFLEHAKVALNDGVTFGRGGEGFVRLNFGTPRAILAEGLERMRSALARAH